MYQPQSDQESAQAKLLREELRQRFPAQDGYEVSEASWIDIVDGKPEELPITTVIGNGVYLTFFPRAPKNPPGSSQAEEAEAER